MLSASAATDWTASGTVPSSNVIAACLSVPRMSKRFSTSLYWIGSQIHSRVSRLQLATHQWLKPGIQLNQRQII